MINDWTYNNVGIVSTESLPYFATGTSRGTATTTSALFVTYTYDALQRVTATANVVGTTQNGYNGWTVTTTDPNGKTKDYIKDAYGNLANVVERISTTTATTTYTWDLNKNFTKITDALSNIRNFTYDGLSRRLTAHDLHGASDGSFGGATTTYDVAGNVTQTVDGKSQTVNFTYDALNRVLTEDYTGASGTEVQYAYDACADGKTRLCAATTSDAVMNLTYSSNGLIATEKRTIDSAAYTTSFTYDRQGNIIDLTYPSNAVVKYVYDNAGLLETISRKKPGGSSYVGAVLELQYAPTGAISYKRFGDGVTTNLYYDYGRLYRLLRINSTASTTQIGGGSGGTGHLGVERDPFSNFAEAHTIARPALAEFTLPLSGLEILERVQPRRIAVEGLGADAVDLVATSTRSETPISDMIGGKSAKDRARIKGEEIAKLGELPRIARDAYDIKVMTMTPIEGGVAVFARAWDQAGQIGFGSDGTVDIERFMLYNPPVLVRDDEGPIVRVYKNLITDEEYTRRYREDPQEALLQVLEHVISVKSLKFSEDHIVSGTVGNTTSSFFPNPDPESSSVDGTVWRNTPAGETWTSLVNGAGTNANDTSTYEWTVFAACLANNSCGQVNRGIFIFDTSPIADGDLIASSTVSLWGLGSGGTAGFMTVATVGIYSSNPASATQLVASDYSTLGTNAYSGTTYSLNGTWSNGSYNTFPMNALGMDAVNKQGVTKIGQRIGNYDGGALTPTSTVNSSIYFATQTADIAGTSNDPMLTVEHGNNASPLLQEFFYQYDSNGNITTLYDSSTNNAAKIVGFTYDDVNRLLTASTTFASSTPYSQSYVYNYIGNLTYKSDVGGYSYAGTSYANPHAPTTINGSTYTYDNNGNLSRGGGKYYSWDYRNRITAAGNGTATSTFGYDHQNQRVRKAYASATTTYPSKYMSKVVKGSVSTTTDYIYMGDTIIAEIEVGNATTSTTTRYFLPDHLNSTNVVTNASGTALQILDYYPYGSTRVSQQTNGFNEAKQFIAQVTDPETNLSYLNARYYNSGNAQFLSEDPVFWGDPKKQNLQNPQDLNSYSYAAGNPIVRSDPSGLWFQELATGKQSWSGFKGEWNMAASQLSQDSSSWNFAMSHPVATGMLVVGPLSGVAAASGVGGFAAARAAGTPLGVSAAYRAKQAFASLVYLGLSGNTLSSFPDAVDSLRQGNPNNPSTYFGTALSLAGNLVPAFSGGAFGAFADVNQTARMMTNSFGGSGSTAYSNSMQMRVGLTNVYNAAAGSSNESKLWVTPNGAVVTWSGGIVAGGIKQ